jgi:spore coat polysaccharide biosynthesis protein SpsF
MDLGGKSVLERVIQRLSRSRTIRQVVVATTESHADDQIVSESARMDVSCFRGAEFDVLDRYYKAAVSSRAQTVVRITSDCPLIDPQLVDDTIGVFYNQKADYASNTLRRCYPRGLDVEVFTFAALERSWNEAVSPYEREHVTPFLYEHPELFRLSSFGGASDYSQYRWTLDTPEDLRLLRAIYDRFDNDDRFSWQEGIALMEREPELAELNAHIAQKPLHPTG